MKSVADTISSAFIHSTSLSFICTSTKVGPAATIQVQSNKAQNSAKLGTHCHNMFVLPSNDPSNTAGRSQNTERDMGGVCSNKVKEPW